MFVIATKAFVLHKCFTMDILSYHNAFSQHLRYQPLNSLVSHVSMLIAPSQTLEHTRTTSGQEVALARVSRVKVAHFAL